MGSEIVAIQKRAIVPSSFNEICTIGKVMAESNLFEDSRDAAKAIVKIMAGAEMGFSPFEAMVNIHIIKGKPTVGANLMASAVKSSGKYDYKVVRLDDEACELEFYERGEKVGVSDFNRSDAQAAGTQNMGKFGRNMMFARAMSNGVKWYCPDVFKCAVYTPEEMGATVNGEGEILSLPETKVAPVEQPAPSQPLGGYDEFGDVWCSCGVKARLITTATATGYVCGHNPKQCNFKMKAPEQATPEVVEGEVSEPAPVVKMISEGQKTAIMALGHKFFGPDYMEPLCQMLSVKDLSELTDMFARNALDRLREEIEMRDKTPQSAPAEEPHPLDADSYDPGEGIKRKREKTIAREVTDTRREDEPVTKTTPAKTGVEKYLQKVCIKSGELGLDMSDGAKAGRIEATRAYLVSEGCTDLENLTSWTQLELAHLATLMAAICNGTVYWPNATEQKQAA